MESEKIKYTNQRVEILNYINSSINHPTVEEIYNVVRKKLTRIIKATVYQNLKYLTEKSLIRKVNFKGISRFESNLNLNHHLICKNSGRVMDFESKELTEFSLGLIKNMNGYQIESATTNFYGFVTSANNN